MPLKANSQSARVLLLFARHGSAQRDRRQHARRIFLLPEHLVELVLARFALERRDVDLTDRGLPLGRKAPYDCARDHDLPGFRLARHAIRGVHGRAEDVPVLEHDRAEVTADANRDRLAFDFELRVCADIVLHAARRIERIVGRGKRGHDLVADRLDHRSMVLLRGRAHDLDTGQHHVAGTQVAHDLIDARAADDVGEQDG